jgi:hypothetical protein
MKSRLIIEPFLLVSNHPKQLLFYWYFLYFALFGNGQVWAEEEKSAIIVLSQASLVGFLDQEVMNYVVSGKTRRLLYNFT